MGKINNRAFIMSGMTFLLVIPAIILAASLIQMMKTADTTTALNIKSDKVFYSSKDLESSFRRAACNYIYVSSLNSGEVNASEVAENLKNIWIPFVENNYSGYMGLNIDVNENFDVTYDKGNSTVIINSSSGGGIDVTIATVNGDINYTFELGPYYLDDSCGNPLKTECNPIAVTANFNSPSSGSTYCLVSGSCTSPITINITVIDNCNTPRVDGDATVTITVYNSSDEENGTLTLTDNDGDGTYTATWYPDYADTYKLVASVTDIYGATGGGDVSNIIVKDCGSSNTAPEIISLSPGDKTSCGSGTQNISFTISDPDKGDTVNWAIVYSTDPSFSSPSYKNGSIYIDSCGSTYSDSVNLSYTTTTYYYLTANDGTNTTKYPSGSPGYYTITVSTDETTPGTIVFNTTETSITIRAPYSGDCDNDNSATVKKDTGAPKSMTKGSGVFSYTFSGLTCNTPYIITTQITDPDNSPPIPKNISIVTTDSCPGGGLCSNSKNDTFPDKTWIENEKGDKDDKTGKNKCNDKDDGINIEEKWKGGKRHYKGGKRNYKIVNGRWKDSKINNNACEARLKIRYKRDKNDPGNQVTLHISFSGGASYSKDLVVTSDTHWTTYTTPWFSIDGTKDTYVELSIKEHAQASWGNDKKKSIKIDCFRIDYTHN